MEKDKSEKRIAYLEFINDQLLTEISYIDGLLKQIGFDNGLATIKCIAEEVIKEELSE